MKRLRRSAAAKLALAFPRLQGLLPGGETFERIDYRWEGEEQRLVVFLPGIDDVAEDFVRRGFVDEARRHGALAGATVLDAHYGYYAARTIHPLLSEDVIAPARAQGYRQVWLTGISLGGFGAASFAASNPEQVAGLMLLAPYLGDDALIREIRSAGGPRQWEPGRIGADDYPRKLWAWLQREYLSGTPQVPLYLGYGEGDRFAPAHRLLAELIGPERVQTVRGGHDWRTWERLWRHFMQREDVIAG